MADEGIEFTLIKVDGQVATKLVETISAGVGALAEPWLIKRRAKAEGAAEVIRAESRTQVLEIEARAENRRLAQEVRRQGNLEAIVQQADTILSAQKVPPAPEPVNPDWTARMLSSAEDVSDDSMRVLWARILAGEVTKPGSYSLRAIETVKNLSKQEAAQFNTLCSIGFRQEATLYPMIFDTESAALRALGLNFTVISELEAIGLLRFEPLNGFTAMEVSRALVFTLADGREVGVRRDSNAPLRLGKVRLTTTGEQLAHLTVGHPNSNHTADVARTLREDGWHVNYLGRNPTTGQVAMEYPI